MADTEALTRQLRRMAAAQGHYNRENTRAVEHLTAETREHTTQIGDLARIAEGHERRLTSLEPRLDGVEVVASNAQARADAAFDRAVEAHEFAQSGGAARSNPIAVLVGAVLGFLVLYWVSGQVNIHHDDNSVRVFFVNLGIARALLGLAGAAIGAVVGSMVTTGNSDGSSISRWVRGRESGSASANSSRQVIVARSTPVNSAPAPVGTGAGPNGTTIHRAV